MRKVCTFMSVLMCFILKTPDVAAQGSTAVDGSVRLYFWMCMSDGQLLSLSISFSLFHVQDIQNMFTPPQTHSIHSSLLSVTP